MEDNMQSLVDDNPDTAEVQAASPDVSPATETPDVAALTAERDQIAQERADLQNNLLRLQADFDNFRKRTERERIEFAEYAGEQTVRALLPVLDDFERALKPEHTANADAEFVRGVELIYNRLMDTLKKLGLEPINTTGEKFDPHQHQAIQRTHSDEHEDGDIVAEYQRGYNFKGRLLRPAMVQVSVKP